jgi:hypothetical protein
MSAISGRKLLHSMRFNFDRSVGVPLFSGNTPEFCPRCLAARSRFSVGNGYVDGQKAGEFCPNLRVTTVLLRGQFDKLLAVSFGTRRAGERRELGLDGAHLRIQERVEFDASSTLAVW